MKKLVLLTPESGSRNSIGVDATCHRGEVHVTDARRWPEGDAHRDMWQHYSERLRALVGNLREVRRDLLIVFPPDGFLRASVLFRQLPSLVRLWPQCVRRTAAVQVSQGGDSGPFFAGAVRDRLLVSAVGLLAMKRVRIEPGLPLESDIKMQLAKIAQRRERDGQPEELTLLLGYASLAAELDANAAGGVVSLQYT